MAGNLLAEVPMLPADTCDDLRQKVADVRGPEVSVVKDHVCNVCVMILIYIDSNILINTIKKYKIPI